VEGVLQFPISNNEYNINLKLFLTTRLHGVLAVSRAFGDLVFKGFSDSSKPPTGLTAKPDIIEKEIGTDDNFLVLGSDGLFEDNTNQQIVDLIKKHKTPQDACAYLNRRVCFLFFVVQTPQHNFLSELS